MGTLQLTFNGTNNINLGNAQPGDNQTKTFTVKNTGTLPVDNYEIYFSNVINTLEKKEEVVYTLTCISDDSNPCNGLPETEVPSVSSSVLIQGSIMPNTTHTYTITLSFKNLITNQNYNQGKKISFKITINELKEYPKLVQRDNYYTNILFWKHKKIYLK